MLNPVPVLKAPTVTAFDFGQQQGWDFKSHGSAARASALSQPAILLWSLLDDSFLILYPETMRRKPK